MSISQIQGKSAPIHLWASVHEVESQALDQLKNIASLPWVFHHVAAMPDVHYGIGATVGSVIAMKGAVAPAAVGVDLSCGMGAVNTTLKAKDLPDSLEALRARIEAAVPVGFAAHPEVSRRVDSYPLWKSFSDLHEGVQDNLGRARQQMGTLGGGNHFIEICLDTEQNVWVMLHSGSRNIGKVLADIHISKARKLAHNQALPDKDLAVFLAGTPEMAAYRRDLSWAQDYARLNRMTMLALVSDVLVEMFPQVEFGPAIVCHHNYLSEENHFGEDVFVTRKGAISARLGEMGIIPGCFAAGIRVLMASGLYKNIEHVRVGDRVIAGDGTTTSVKRVFQNGTRSTWRYKNNAFHAETSATPDHQHFVGDMSSSNIQTQGRLKIMSRPNRDGSSKYRWAPLREMVPRSFTLLMPRRINFAEMPSSFRVVSDGLALESSYALGYVFGSFLGDGTCRYKLGDGGQVSWALGLHEQDIAERINASLASALGIKAKVYPGGKCLLVVVHNAELAKFFARFGKKDKKAIPEEFWCRHHDYMKGLSDGLFDTDGHENAKTRKLTNTSSTLIEQYGVIHFLLQGYFPSVSVRPPSAGGLTDCSVENCKPSFRSTSLLLPPLTENHQLVELLQVNKEERAVDVFDIEVEHPDHSFIANNAIVHNSMGTRSYIVRGKGSAESFCSASHGAGRRMSRGQAKKRFTVEDLAAQTAGVCCKKDVSVLDEIPGAYKEIERVMENQRDLVEVVAELKQILCVKG